MDKSVDLYDNLAGVYDELYNHPCYSWENEAIGRILAPHVNNRLVVDVGCGTGLLLEICDIPSYIGVDPSANMLKKLKEKFPDVMVCQSFFEEFKVPSEALIISLFGSISYVSPLRIRLSDFEQYFLMFYIEGYTPKTHAVAQLHNAISYEFDSYSLHGADIYKFTNYYVVTNLRVEDENLQRRNGIRCGDKALPLDI